MDFLTDILPPKARKYVYAVLSLAALVWGAYQAAGGDWGEAIGSLVVTLVNAMAVGNTAPAYDAKHDAE